jgi:hypothetical protein
MNSRQLISLNQIHCESPHKPKITNKSLASLIKSQRPWTDFKLKEKLMFFDKWLGLTIISNLI